MKNRAVGWVKNLLKYGIGFGLLALVLVQNWEPKFNALGKEVNPGLKGLLQKTPDFLNYGALVALSVVCSFTQFFRWFLLVRALDLPFTYGVACRLGLVGCFWNAFTPGSVGGDLVKAYYIARGQPGRRTAAVATVIADRLVGLFGLIWFSAVFGSAFWIAGNQWIVDNDYIKDIVRVCSGLTVAAVVGWIVMGLLPKSRADRFAERITSLPRRVLSAVGWVLRKLLPQKWGDRLSQSLLGISKGIGDTLAEAWYSVYAYRQRPRAVYVTILMTAFVHTCFVMMFFLAVRVFPADEPASFPETIVVAPIGYIAQAFFPAPGGVGGGEYIFGYLYKLMGRPESTGVIGRLTLRVNEWCIGLVGLYFYLRMKDELRVVEEEVEKDENAKAPEGVVPLQQKQEGFLLDTPSTSRDNSTTSNLPTS